MNHMVNPRGRKTITATTRNRMVTPLRKKRITRDPKTGRQVLPKPVIFPASDVAAAALCYYHYSVMALASGEYNATARKLEALVKDRVLKQSLLASLKMGYFINRDLNAVLIENLQHYKVPQTVIGGLFAYDAEVYNKISQVRRGLTKMLTALDCIKDFAALATEVADAAHDFNVKEGFDD